MNRKILPYIDEIERIKNGETVYPITCEIDPANRCQNYCHFCVHRNSINGEYLGYSVYRQLLSELHSLGTKSITFTGGGEPLCHPRIEDMVLDAKDRFEIGLVTNGVALEKITPWLFKFIRVSLYGWDRESYKKVTGVDNFEKVIDNIININKRATTLGLSCIVTKDDEKNIAKYNELADSLQVDYVQFKPLLGKDLPSITGKKAIATERYLANSSLPCQIAGLVGVVGADAKVYYCCLKRGLECLGSLEEESFSSLWEKRKYVKPKTNCGTCRYMNYAKEYEKLTSAETFFLKHRSFL